MDTDTVHALKRRLIDRTCRTYRQYVLRRPVFIAITGSCGKTTTKELTASILESQFSGLKNPSSLNIPWHIVRQVFRTKPWDDYSIVEVGAAGDAPIPLERTLGLFQPTIGVVTNVGFDHFTVFGSQEAIAGAKSKMVSHLPSYGTAVLNADDPRVLSMRRLCKGDVMTYGVSPEAMLRGQDISSVWPDRLSLVATLSGQSVRVQTQLCGMHLASTVLAALAIGHVMGVPLRAAADALRNADPFPGRMSPVDTVDGITFIRDDAKAPLWTVPSSLEFMRTARARRKIVVLGTLSDFPGNTSRRCRDVAQNALEVADAVIGVGYQGTFYLRARPGAGQVLRAFRDAAEARAFLRDFAEPGDIVLLKGSERADSLGEIAARWQPRDRSTLKVRPAQLSGLVSASPAPRVHNAHLVVGLGNPEPRLALTPHNVGYRAVEALAARLGLSWEAEEGALMATACWHGQQLHLVKTTTCMNDTGPQLRLIADRLGIAPEQCVIVFDDINLAPGAIRRRENGSSGHHNGMASIIVAFQSENIRRVKIGIGRPAAGDITSYVLAPFAPEHVQTIERACDQAADVVLQMVTTAQTCAPPLAKNLEA